MWISTDSRHNFGLALFAPVRDFCVNLVPQLRFDFPCIAGKKGEKPLGSAVDHVNLMQRYCVHDFFPLLYLALWAPNEFCLVLSSKSSKVMAWKNVHLHP